MKYIIVSLIWALYCFIHSLLISTWFTNSISRLLKKYYAFYRLFYILFSLVTLILLMNYSSTVDNEIIFTYSFPWDIIRNVLKYGSLLVFFYAFFFNYDSLSFFGIRQIFNMNKTRENNSVGTISKKGLLGVIRHPLYLTLLIFLWCNTLKMIDVYLNILLTLYVIIGTLLEEKKLVLEFGNAYTEYQKEVPMLIPFIKRRTS